MHYEPRIELYSEGHLIQDWEDPTSQAARFDALIDNVPLQGCSLLDVGSGVGDLLSHLRRRRIVVDYTGIDILVKMVELARELHPERRFECVDLLRENPYARGAFDVVLCSGVFNLGGAGECAFACELVAVLADIADEYLVFNMLDANSPTRDPAYSYFKPEDVITWPGLAGMRVKVVRGYLSNDFTLVCVRS